MKSAFEFKRETVKDLESKYHDTREFNRTETKAIQELCRSRRIALLRNNLILVAVLNFLTISGLVCCLAYYEWFHLGQIWVGLLYLYDEKSGSFYKISHFISLQCEQNTNEICDVLDKFLFSGKICTVFLTLGLSLHLIFFGHIIFLALKRINDIENFGIKIFKPLIFKILAMICYVFSLIFWAFFNKTYELEGKIGISLFAGIAACSIYLLLLIYYGVLKRELMKGVIIDNLLNPDKFLESFQLPVN